MREKLGECLVQAGLITDADLQAALAERGRAGTHLGEVLVRMHLATDAQIASVLARQLGFPYFSPVDEPPDAAVTSLIPRETAFRHACLAIELDQHVLTVAMADPLQFSLVQDLEAQTGYRIRAVVGARSEIVAAIESAYADQETDAAPGQPSASGSEPDDDVDDVERPSGAELAHLVLATAVENRASDVHIDPGDLTISVRHRLDGHLKEVLELPIRSHLSLVAALKEMSGMDVAEKRLPQAGRLRLAAKDGAAIDFRVSTLRTAFGEKVVLRRLDRGKRALALDVIGLSPRSLEVLGDLLRRPTGLLIIAGPAAGGKTTTACAALASIGLERSGVVTIEDSVEYDIGSQVVQTSVGDVPGVTRTAALRSAIDRDPDVILIDELQDAATAQLALEAARTRLVVTTVPADGAAGAMARLVELGVDAAAVASTVVGVVSQRLVRRLCVRCRRPYAATAEELRALGMADAEAGEVMLFAAVGCDQCDHAGYRGRIGVFEVMRVGDAARALMAAGVSGHDLRKAAMASGLTSLGEDLADKVRSGVTTHEERRHGATETGDLRSLCAVCGSAVSADFLACPACGSRLDNPCPHCRRSLRPGWTFCPYCARSASSGTLPRPLS